MARAFRLSPSGPAVAIASTSDDVENLSEAPGLTLSRALETTLNPARVRYFDEFQGGRALSTNNSTGAGELKWVWRRSNAVNTWTKSAAVGGNGIGVGTVNLTAGSSAGLILGSGFRPDQIESAQFRAIPEVSVAQGSLRFGFGTDPAAANSGSDGIFFLCDNAFGPRTWQAVMRKGGVSVLINTGISALTPPDVLLLTRDPDANTYSFFVNGVLGATFSNPSEYPTVDIAPIVAGTAGGGAALAAAIDTFEMFCTRAGF